MQKIQYYFDWRCSRSIRLILERKTFRTYGEAGVLSFNGNKPITCGAGGAIITNNKKLSINTKHLSTHAKINDLVDHVHDAVGYNYRMNNLSAAVGCAQIENIKKIMKLKRIILIGIIKFLRILNTLILLKSLTFTM